MLNAAAAYGGARSGPFRGGPIAEADLDGFDSWAAAPARAAFSFLSAGGRFAMSQGRAATLVLRHTRAPAHPAGRELDALNMRAIT